ncbi:MAG: molecular chaperone HtpG [Pseudomonadota bacterium]
MTEQNRETHAFQTEVQQLLHLMIHSLYSNREVFLRELVSNASDACDKLRFEALTQDGLFEDDPELRVTISYEPEGETLTIADNGIGMSREEVIENLGTIARSGTRRFLEQMSGDAAKDASLIGQFGVGFYSAFVVADRVTVETRRAGASAEDGVRWVSDGTGEFSVEGIERAGRGTAITLHLKEDHRDLLNGFTLRNILTKYADHIGLPVQMPVEKEGKPVEDELETVNQASALWARPRKDITDDEYQAFYKHVSHDFDDPQAWTHHRVEGRLDYTALLYVPKRPPFDLNDIERQRGVKLYVQRVFIMDDAQQLMPRYLRFVRGLIDSNDLPLNVSRELLQSNKVVDSIRGGCTRKVLGLLEDMATKEPEDYQTFWNTFGNVLKEGTAEDAGNRETLAKLLRFASTENDGAAQTVSLADYVARLKGGQEHIYYITADSYASAAASPHLEMFREKGLEVLLLHDRVDEWVVGHLTEFEGHELRSINRGEVPLGEATEDEKKAQEAIEEEYKEFVARIESILRERVESVRVSQRLTDSPSCVVTPEGALGGRLERMLRDAGQEVPESKPILELNPTHPVVLKARHEEDKDRFSQWAHVLLDQALLAEGDQLTDPQGFVKRLNELLVTLA